MSTTPHDERSDPPLLAGRYELGTTLGRGGMADVYRATDRLLNRAVAVKVLRETAGDESDRERFVAEARTLARLSHSGLVMILDAGFGQDAGAAAGPATQASSGAASDHPFLVMELVEGRTLAQAIAAGPLPLDEVASIGSKVAEALAHVHEHGVVHRDVKPGNVLLGQEGQVKLADFGIARLLDDSSRHTRTGHTIGTAAYLAPEQVSGQEVSGASDVYALGLVLLEAVTGRLEYPGPAMEAAVARLNRPPRMPDELPAPWRQMLGDMTALDPVHRPGAAQVAEWLREPPTEQMPVPADVPPNATQVLPDMTPAASPPPPPPAPTPRTSLIDRAGDSVARQPRVLVDRVRAMPSSQRGVLGAIVALLLVLLVVAVVGFGSDDGGTDPTTDIPRDTPSELRAPLEELHRAVHGEQE